MKSLPIAIGFALLLSVAPAYAKSPAGHEPKGTVSISPGELAPSPEMWFYEQAMRQYQDPKTGVRQKAEFRASQRQRRLTAMKWFGLSNTRPIASADAIHSDYSPAWTSNQANHPMLWNAGAAGGTLVVQPESSASGR